MSWHFSRALEEAYLAENSSDGELFAPWKLIHFAADDLCSGKMKGTCHRSLYGMMYLPSMDHCGMELLMWFLGGFHARTLARLENEQELTEIGVDYGKPCHESLAKYDLGSRLWKTRQSLLFEDSTESLETFPKWGMACDMELWELQPSGFLIIDPEYGWLPTPRKSMATHGICWKRADSKHKGNLEDFLAQQLRKTGVQRIVGLTVSASFVTLLMDWPQKWASCKPLGTDKFQQWLGSHGKH